MSSFHRKCPLCGGDLLKSRSHTWGYTSYFWKKPWKRRLFDWGAERWLKDSPVLMAKDHVHFTIAGYKKSAAAFLETLIPVIDKVRSRSDAVSNN